MLRKIVAWCLVVINCLTFGVVDIVLFGILRAIIVAITWAYAKVLVDKGGNKEDVQKVKTVCFFLIRPLIYTPLDYISVVACYIINLVLYGDNATTLYDQIIDSMKHMRRTVSKLLNGMFDAMV